MLNQLLIESKNPVFFTGAGISTDSGIPDFRGPKGIWKTSQPIYFQEFLESEEKRIESWQRKFSNELSISGANPNSGHLKIAEIMDLKQDSHLITQNVDNLHQESGIKESQITELHGNATYAKCLDCELIYSLSIIKEEFLKTGKAPVCTSCKGIIKTATISFGQPMPEKEMIVAQRRSIASDLFICIGTSLAVFPAADLPVLAKEVGAKVIIINNEPTQLDHIADLVINRDISEVLSEIEF